jgi:hypothetical protein
MLARHPNAQDSVGAARLRLSVGAVQVNQAAGEGDGPHSGVLLVGNDLGADLQDLAVCRPPWP